jgi:hypothetical protein
MIAVVDQFEEVVGRREGAALQTAARFLQHLRENPIEGFTLVLAVRSDFLESLDRSGMTPLTRFEIPPFTFTEAYHFLSAPESGLDMDAARLRQVLWDACEMQAAAGHGKILPVTANMLGLVLRRAKKSPPLGWSARNIFAQDLRTQINEPQVRQISHIILSQMVSAEGTTLPKSVSELYRITGVEANAIHTVLLHLETSGYVRQLNRAHRVLEQLWEISSDFVAPLLTPILRFPR